jgi:hypothetical protein
VTLLANDAPVRVSMGCAWCAWRVVMSGPAFEVATFLRDRAEAHVRERHPDRAPTGDLTLAVLDELGFH